MMCEPIVRAVRMEPDQVALDLDLPPDLACFQGHFPGFPVLPGVVQIDWAMWLGVAHRLSVQRSANDFRIKFTRVITPNTPLTLTLRHDADRGRLEFIYRTGALMASRGHVALTQS